MHYIIGLVVAMIVLYFLIVGGILIWPIMNVIAYLKVLIFPWPIRKKYGSSISDLSNESFDVEITEDDVTELKNLEDKRSELVIRLNHLNKKFESLGPLKKNTDGSISQRSKAGKEGVKIVEKISFTVRQIDFHSDEIISILNKPWLAWSSWSQRYARYLGNRDAILFMLLGFPTFFLIVGQLNPLELKYPTFENLVEIYIYITFVAPVSNILDISLFKEGFFSTFISYDYAVMLTKNYNHIFTFYNWVVLTLPMPLLTLLFYFLSNIRYEAQAKGLKPNTSHWH